MAVNRLYSAITAVFKAHDLANAVLPQGQQGIQAGGVAGGVLLVVLGLQHVRLIPLQGRRATEGQAGPVRSQT